MKSKKIVLTLTSVVCLLPIILALAIYGGLPDSVVMQWNFAGEPNRYAPKAVAAFGLPILFALINIVTLLIMFNDPKRQNISDKMVVIVQWLVPLTSLIVVPLILFSALGIALPIVLIVFTFVGLILILVGNYLPQCKHNYSVGIRLPWTLSDEENWNKTHRIGGILWTICGFLFIVFGFLRLENTLGLILIISLLITMSVAPIIYSYLLYKRKK